MAFEWSDQANPTPEIVPDVAPPAAAVVATERPDFRLARGGWGG
jgi:malic enzyme